MYETILDMIVYNKDKMPYKILYNLLRPVASLGKFARRTSNSIF